MRDELKNIFYKKLLPIQSKREVDQILRIYLEDKEFQSNMDLSELLEIVNSDVDQLINNYPIQYITGKAFFYDRAFQVNKQVLIPRPETEELVHLVIKNHKNEQGLRILDIGTGSGCIPIILASKLVGSHITTIDISEDALKIAQINHQVNNGEIDFVHNDFLDPNCWQNFPVPDILVSNPPYIQRSEIDVMTKSTLKYEPGISLIPQGDDPLIFYRKIALYATERMKQGSKVYAEINEFLKEETMEIFEAKLSQCICHTDMQGKPRIIECKV